MAEEKAHSRAASATRHRLRGTASAVSIAVAIAICIGLATATAQAAAASGSRCGARQIRTASGCTSLAAVRRHVHRIVRRTLARQDLRAALLRVDVGNRTLVTAASGESMAGVPASLRMHFRIGSIAIPYLVDLLLQLQDQGRLSLDDPVSKWLPGLPNARRVTLRMLASATSGYPDWIQENPAFSTELFANPFRQWTTHELLDIALARPLICAPGTCFHYAHTNFNLLTEVIRKVTGRPVKTLLRRRILGPLGLRHTEISSLPRIPDPVLHAYTSDRGPYEDSTYWSPSWTIAEDMIMTGTIADAVKSAKAIGTGALISRRAARERVAPVTARFPGFSRRLYYGLGILVANGWQLQNPELQGYTAISAYLPSRRIALALTATKGKAAAATETNYSELLFSELTQYLTPGHAVVVPGNRGIERQPQPK
jgi:D-alanyl-D-alanine carboxypeptidase